MLQARTQLLGTQASIPPLETGLQQARNALSTLLGRPPGGVAEILGSQPGVIPAPPRIDGRGRSRRPVADGVPMFARPNSRRRHKARRWA